MPSPFTSSYADYHETSGSGYGLLDHLWYGSISTVASAVDSVRNSIAWLGGDSYEKIDTYDTLRKYDDDLAAYYNDNRTAVDFAGLIAGSLVPGGLAVKAATVMQLGKWGFAGSRITGILASERSQVIAGALAEMKTASTGITGQIQAAKYRAGVMGLKDNIVQNLFFEGAVISTMHQSPVFDEMDTKDMVINSLIGLGLGSAIGTGIDYLKNARTLKGALRERETALRPYESGGGIETLNVTPGDKIDSLIFHLEQLPKVDKADPYHIAQAGVKEVTSRDTLRKISSIANDMAGGDAGLGKPLAETVIKDFQATGNADFAINTFSQAQKISRVSLDDAVSFPVFYLRRKGDTAVPVTSFSDIISPKPLANAAGDIAYSVVPGAGQPSIGFVGVNGITDIKTGYNAGFDIIIDAKQQAHINPNTSRITRASRPGEDKILGIKQEIARKQTGINPPKLTGSIYIDFYSGRYADNAYPGASDLFDLSKAQLVNSGEELVGGGQIIAKFSDAPFANIEAATAQEMSARWSLAAIRGLKERDQIAPNDLPFLVKAFSGATGNLNLPGDLPDLIQSVVRETVDVMLSQKKSLDEISKAIQLPRTVLDKMDFSWKTLSSIYSDPEWMKYAVQPSQAKLTFNIGNEILPTVGMAVRGMAAVQARIKLAEEVNRIASATYLGDIAQLLPNMAHIVREQASAASGAGASMIKFAEGNYGDIASITQFIGSLVHRVKQEKLNAIISSVVSAGSTELIRDQKLATEFGLIAHAVQSSPEKYVLIRNAAGETIGTGLESVAQGLQGTARLAKDEMIQDAASFLQGKNLSLPENYVLANPSKGQRAAFIFFEEPGLGKLISAHHQITSSFADQINRFYAAQGHYRAGALNPDHLYFAPVDINRFKHHAFIRDKQGGFGNTSNVGAVYGRDLAEFQRNLSRINTENYEIITDRSSKLYHEALGDWDYSLAMNSNTTDTFLKREGMMAEFYPTLNGKELLERQLDYYRRQVSRITNNYVELHYAREFEELRQLGDTYMSEALSVSRRTAKGVEKAVDDPFRSYIKTALDQSRIKEHRWWNETAEMSDAFASSAFRKAKEAFGMAAKGDISFDAANDMAEKAGLGRIYENMATDLMGLADKPAAASQFAQYQGTNFGRQVLTKFVSTANSALASLVLRLDVANSIINTVSLPVLLGPELRSVMKHIDNPKVVGELQRMLTVGVPGGDNKLPSATKLVYSAVKNFLGPNRRELLEKYKALGFTRNPLDLYHDMLDDIAITGYETPKRLQQLTQAVVDKGSKLSGNDLAENFTRFISANIMDQLTTAAGLDARTSAAYMNTFVNRVNGIFLASQRPVLFQGPVGQAIGLFQTYQFNLMQNLFRHFENGDRLTGGMLLGLQGTVFGLQGLPGFQIINQHLVATMRGNPEHKDFYSEMPEWLMYGSASWLSDTSLYTRGDITPRNLTVVPVNPMETPIGNATAKIINNTLDFARNLSEGASVADSLAFAMEHNGISRPLSGLAVSIKGERTSGKGSLIAKNLDFFSWESAKRVIGSKPLDEAIAMDAHYRMSSFRAHDKALREELGSAVKIRLLGGDMPSDEEVEDLMVTYAKYGGTQEGFNRWFMNIISNTEESVANRLAAKVNSPLGRRMQEIMGGEELPDYSQ